MSAHRKKIGLFTLGITLILVGAAIMLNRYTQYQFLKDLYLMWPAFLILLGLEFIVTKVYYDYKHQDVQLSPSGLSIFLAIVMIFTSFLWTNVNISPFKLNLNFNQNSNWISNYQHMVEETYQPDSIVLNGAQRLVVNNVRGSVDIQPSAGNQLEVEASIRIATNQPEEAKRLINEVVRIQTGNTTTITAQSLTQSNDHSLQFVNLTIRVPQNVAVDVSTRFGDILIANIENNVTASQEHSSVDISNILGDVNVNCRHGRVRVKQVEGELEIINAHGAVDVQGISGTAKVENSYSSTTVADIGRDARVNSRHGQVRLERVAGSAQVDNEYNSTYCIDIGGSLNVRARHSAVTMEGILGDIQAETSYSAMRLTNNSFANADIKANTSYSAIKGDRGVALDISDERNLQEASAYHGNGNQKIRLKNHHGDIRIETNE